MSNEELANCVNEELYWDPQIGGESITVEADDGVVVLRGKVGSLRQKRAAKKTAARVRGVRSVENDLRVPLKRPDAREDAALRADVLEALSLDALVPRTIGVSVDGGVVILTEHDEAIEAAWAVSGVRDVEDRIRVKPPSTTED